MPYQQIPHARAAWRTSSYTGQQGACVEVADLATCIGIRDTKDRSGPVLHFDRTAIKDLAARIRRGELDF
jgi:hypothetical protein